jgi:two-component system sensor histidine kinase/response regulator
MSKQFDENELLERVDNDIAFLSETVEMLATDGRTLMAEVKQALAANDAAALGRTAHTLKGMISNFCAPQLHASAFEVERMGKSGDVAMAGQAVQKVEAELELLIAELVEFVKGRT